MKTCPKCERNYSDETLNFCLDDGAVLIAENAAATSENILRPTEQQTEILSQETITEAINYKNETADLSDENTEVINSQSELSSQPQIIKEGVSPLFAYLSVGLLGVLVLIAGIGIIYYISSNSGKTANSDYVQSNSNSNDLKITESELNLPGVNSNESVSGKTTPSPDSKIIEQETPKKEKEKVNPTPLPTSAKTPTPKPSKTPEPEKGRYFVILGSYQDSANANKRLMLARSKGLRARIVNTSNVPGLRSGLQAVVLGPFSKSAARKVLIRAKGVSSDAYIKEG